MMIGYDIWDRFTMEHFPLSQSMNLTTSFFARDSTFTFTMVKVNYVQNAPQDIRENRGILNRILLSWIRRTEAYIANDGKHFEQLL
jgi:hypothetical protein